MTNEHFNGLLFIGDPHVSSKRPGRRKDDYLSSVLDKLTACAEIANSRNYKAIILGDLFHKNDDSNLKMLNRLMRVLKLFKSVPLVLEGNHDKGQLSLSDEDALMLLEQSGCIKVVTEEGLHSELLVGGSLVGVHFAPYGAAIPTELDTLSAEINILVTHHDMAFGSAYPGSLPLSPIKGADMVINGHMHDTKKSVLAGNTWWHNPGNIEPLSVDLLNHVPHAWSWAPSQGFEKLQGHSLPHGTDLFDMTGIAVEAADSFESVRAVAAPSAFALELSAQTTMDADRTDDASVLVNDLETVLGAADVSDATKLLLRSLAQTLG